MSNEEQMNQDDPATSARIAPVRRLFEEVFGKGAKELIPELCADPGAITRGLEKITMLRGAFPDLRYDVERYTAEGEFVIVYFKARGTHTGELMGRPPTGKSIVLDGSNIYRVRGDQIVEGWGHLNTQDGLKDLMK
jgi:predicted ester cyclase